MQFENTYRWTNQQCLLFDLSTTLSYNIGAMRSVKKIINNDNYYYLKSIMFRCMPHVKKMKKIGAGISGIVRLRKFGFCPIARRPLPIWASILDPNLDFVSDK
jgi:hypothetical protein